ncbi:MAG TPA: SDR family oxidoreductase, partial [Planctomycetota bacterium]|nr:SDR family oxidoreductase [Planctomycetota bacterium]
MATAPPVAVITGSSRGIGLAIAHALAAAGHRLVLVAREQPRLAAARATLTAAGGPATADAVATLALDLQTPHAAARVIAFARERFGAPSVLVNNAGTAPSARITDTDEPMLQAALELHVKVPLALIRDCLPAMQQAGAGCIVQLASTAGLRGFPFTTAYTAAKHGMVGLTRALAAELGPSPVRTYAVCPGFVDTDITRQAANAIAARGKTTAAQAFARMGAQNRIGRMHSVADVADAVAMLVR